MGRVLVTPRGEAIIRPAALEDVEAFRALRLESLRLHAEAFGQDHAAAAAEGVDYWVDRLRQNTGDAGAIFFAEAGEGLVGMVGVRLGYAPKAAHNALIWGVYVRAEWRGLKVADTMIESCIDWAAGRGARLVKLAVVTTNTAAIRCYARCGFTVYGIEPEALLVNGMYHDELLMTRRL